jgi:hypothetical protein
MSKFKVKSAVVVLVTLTLAIAGFVTPANATTNFKDVPSDHMYEGYIMYMREKGISYGFNNGTEYRPESFIKRKELTALIIKAKYSPQEISNCISSNGYTGKNIFNDVPSTHHFAPFVCMAKVKNIAMGYSDGRFGPDDDTTVAAGIKMILRTLVDNLPLGINQPLGDYTVYLWDRGVSLPTMNRDSTSQITMKRSEVARVFYAALEESKNWGLKPTPTPTPPITLPSINPLEVLWEHIPTMGLNETIRRSPNLQGQSTISIRVQRFAGGGYDLVTIPLNTHPNGDVTFSIDYYEWWGDDIEPYAIAFPYSQDTMNVNFSFSYRKPISSSPGSNWTVWLVRNY